MLLVSERLNWIDARGAARGNPGGHCTGDGQDADGGSDAREIVRLNAVKEIGDNSSEPPGGVRPATMPHPRIQPASLKTILSDDALPSLPADRASYTGHRARVVVRRASRARAQWTDHIVRALIVNVVERFSIAAFMHAALALSLSATARSAITIGFIGGLTTYSSFNYETSRLFEEGAIGAAVLNATATIFGAFAAGWLGMLSARLLLDR